MNWILGQPGTGKTTVLEQTALTHADIGEGFVYLDPHYSDFIRYLPKRRHADLIVFDLTDTHPIPWNLLSEGDAHTASILLDTFKAVWKYEDLSTPQLDQTLFNSLMATIGQGTMLNLYLLLAEEQRATVDDPIISHFFDYFYSLPEKERHELVRSTINKVQMLLADKRIRRVLAHPDNKLTFTDILKDRKILYVRLPVLEFGDKTRTVGSLLLAQLLLSLKDNTKPFHVFIDDVFYFQSPVLKTLLSIGRKHHLTVHAVSQYLAQLQPDVRDAFIGNMTTKVGFKMGIKDSLFLDKEFRIKENDLKLHELPPFMAYRSTPQSVVTKTYDYPERKPLDSYQRLLRLSRRQYASQAKHIDAKIAQFMEGHS